MSRSPKKNSKKLSDEMLMEAFIQHRDKEAFIHIYNRYFSTLSKYVSWLANDLDLGKDIAQNIFMKIYHRPEMFDPSRNLKVWLFSVAKNQWKNELRNKANKLKHQPFIIKNSIINIQESDDDIKIRRLESLNMALASLSENHKEVVILKYSNNLTIKEISSVLNCSEGTVKSRLFYALKCLKKEVDISKTSEL